MHPDLMTCFEEYHIAEYNIANDELDKNEVI